MSLRDYVYSLIKDDDELADLGYHDDFLLLQHSIDTPQIRPFMVLRWLAVNPGFTSGDGSPMNRVGLQVWCHDVWGSYARIDPALIRLRRILTPLVGVNVGGDDEWLSTVVWEGDSEGLDDDELRTATRNAQFRFTGTGI